MRTLGGRSVEGLLLILVLTYPCVKADGMGFLHSIGVEEYEVDFSEDLQLVYMEANQTHQRTELFIAVKPFDTKGHNLTVAVPMLAPPLKVDGERMATEDFRVRFGLDGEGERSLERNLSRGIDNTAAYFRFFRARTLPGLFIPLSSLVSIMDAIRGYYRGDMTWGRGKLGEEEALPGVELMQSYSFEGVSMEVYRYDDYHSLEALLGSLGLVIPDSAEEEVEKYESHYISALKMQLIPPVDSGTLQYLEAYCPDTVNEFLEWVVEKEDLLWYYRLDHGWDSNRTTMMVIHRFIDSAWDEAISGDTSDMATANPPDRGELSEHLSRMIRCYLSYPEEGYRISFSHTHNGTIWYPLGTSSSWNHPIGLTEVLVKLERGLWLEDTNPSADAAFSSSGNAFYWLFQDANPNQDLSGQISNQGFRPLWVTIKNSFAVVLNGNHKLIAFGLDFSIHLLAWLVAIMVAMVAVPGGWRDASRRHLGQLAFGLSSVTYLFSVFPVLLAFPILYLRRKKGDGGEMDGENQTDLSRVKGTLILLLLSWVAFALFVLAFSVHYEVALVMILFFLIASGIWLFLVAVVFAGPVYEWRGGGNRARQWGLCILVACVTLLLYALSA